MGMHAEFQRENESGENFSRHSLDPFGETFQENLAPGFRRRTPHIRPDVGPGRGRIGVEVRVGPPVRKEFLGFQITVPVDVLCRHKSKIWQTSDGVKKESFDSSDFDACVFVHASDTSPTR